MKCFTARIRKSYLSVENGITHRITVDNNGFWSAFGESRIAVDRAMFNDPNAYDCHDGRLIVWQCRIQDEEAPVIKVVPTEPCESSALILVDADNCIAEVTPYAALLKSAWEYIAHPTSGVHAYQARKLMVKLEPGTSIDITVTSPCERLLGMPVSKGVSVVIRLSFDGEQVSMEIVSRGHAADQFSKYEFIGDLLLLGVNACTLGVIVLLIYLVSHPGSDITIYPTSTAPKWAGIVSLVCIGLTYLLVRIVSCGLHCLSKSRIYLDE